MNDIVFINDQISTPKFQQIITSIEQAINCDRIKVGDQLPSIQQLCKSFQLAPGTVTKAYDVLRDRGIIKARKGKGYYVNTREINRQHNILMLFDELNPYKKTLYHAFKDAMGANAKLHLYFHHHDKVQFERLVLENLGSYSHYVIMPHVNEDVSHIISKIPEDKVLLLDRNVAVPGRSVTAVFQDFRNDIFQALSGALDSLKRYDCFHLVLSSNSFQFIPEELIEGFYRFCREFGICHEVIDNLEKTMIKKGHVYIVFTDEDLVRVFKTAGEHGWALGKELGLISYDDTPLKEILGNGVTVISTEFSKMGQTAANMIIRGKKGQIANPCRLIRRNTF